MKVRTVIGVMLLAASVSAWAQAPAETIGDARRLVRGIGRATETKRENAAKQLGLSSPGNVSTATGTKPATVQKAQGATEASATVKTAAKSKAVEKAESKKTVAGKERGPSTNGTAAAPEVASDKKDQVLRGRRDPFQTIIRTQTGEVACATGKKCLVIGKIDLKGIVRSQNGMIAIVSNQQRKTYFLHENDPVFNGAVVKITPDSVVFRETVVDRVGRQSTREIVKRIVVAPAA